MTKARDGVEDLKTIDANLAAKAPIASPVFTGNLGIGVTPESWSSNNPALQIGSGGVLYSHVSNGTRVSLQGNAYVNSSNADAYITTNEASQHLQEDGTHIFKVAASGSADAAITWTTGLEVLASGKARAKNGLLFGTDTAAANTLDDYETGSWTPVYQGAGGTSGGAYGAQEGTYTKIGQLVHLQAYVNATNKGTLTGSLKIGGFPFTVNPTNQSAGAIGYQIGYNLGSSHNLALWAYSGNFAYLYQAGGSSNSAGLTTGDCDNAIITAFSITYHTNQ